MRRFLSGKTRTGVFFGILLVLAAVGFPTACFFWSLPAFEHHRFHVELRLGSSVVVYLRPAACLRENPQTLELLLPNSRSLHADSAVVRVWLCNGEERRAVGSLRLQAQPAHYRLDLTAYRKYLEKAEVVGVEITPTTSRPDFQPEVRLGGLILRGR